MLEWDWWTFARHRDCRILVLGSSSMQTPLGTARFCISFTCWAASASKHGNRLARRFRRCVLVVLVYHQHECVCTLMRKADGPMHVLKTHKEPRRAESADHSW